MTKEIHIEWEGPLSQEEAVKAEGGGIYQFYGWHSAYSSKDKEFALLYIGIACKFKFRLLKHELLDPNCVPTFFRPKEVKIHLGRVVSNEKEVAIENIEGMLITVHPPAWNSEKVRVITTDKEAKVIIHNTGDKGDLLEEFSISPEGEIIDRSK